jgi:hypothetical protein
LSCQLWPFLDLNHVPHRTVYSFTCTAVQMECCTGSKKTTKYLLIHKLQYSTSIHPPLGPTLDHCHSDRQENYPNHYQKVPKTSPGTNKTHQKCPILRKLTHTGASISPKYPARLTVAAMGSGRVDAYAAAAAIVWGLALVHVQAGARVRA